MEIMIQWFWILKLILSLVFAFTVYKAISWGFKNKVYNVLSVVFLVLAIVSPIKLQPESLKMYKNEDKVIQSTKVLPNKIVDKSFKDSGNSLQGISKEDLK